MAITFDPAIHPGEILREQFLEPLGMSAGALAKAIGVPRTRVERIVKETIRVTPDTALRLAKYFDTTPKLWLNMQNSYDLAVEAASLRQALEAIQTRAMDEPGNDTRPSR